LLQQTAVELLTIFRHLEIEEFRSEVTIVTTDFEALYAYKRGDYQRCLELSTQNIRTLLSGKASGVTSVETTPEFIQLMDDEAVSLIALIMIVNPEGRYQSYSPLITCFTQLTLSVYLRAQCQLKLCPSPMSIAKTQDYIEDAKKRQPFQWTLNTMMLRLTEYKLLAYSYAAYKTSRRLLDLLI